MLPITTLVGVSLAGMLGGTTIVENVFSWPGLGQLAMEAITAREDVYKRQLIWSVQRKLNMNLSEKAFPEKRYL